MLKHAEPPYTVGSPMFQYRVEDGEKFANAGGERHLLGLPCLLHTLVEASSGAGPCRHSDEGCDLLVCQRAGFREAGQ